MVQMSTSVGTNATSRHGMGIGETSISTATSSVSATNQRSACGRGLAAPASPAGCTTARWRRVAARRGSCPHTRTVPACAAETALRLALREAVTNVVRHAHARQCTVALRRVDDRVELEVADDGVGGDQREGNGLTGMRERIAALGGEVRWLARGGTALTVAVPEAVAT
jgi:Histidine kinase-like ATPase domain